MTTAGFLWNDAAYSKHHARRFKPVTESYERAHRPKVSRAKPLVSPVPKEVLEAQYKTRTIVELAALHHINKCRMGKILHMLGVKVARRGGRHRHYNTQRGKR